MDDVQMARGTPSSWRLSTSPLVEVVVELGEVAISRRCHSRVVWLAVGLIDVKIIRAVMLSA